jgi:hypothetical protein
VKIRGFRIELGDIEATLRTFSSVREALVLARDENDGEKRLIAYVSADLPIDISVLRKFLLERDCPITWYRLRSLSSNGGR